LRNISFNKAFSSSMHRPYETAQIILQNNKDLKIEKICFIETQAASLFCMSNLAIRKAFALLDSVVIITSTSIMN